MPRTARKKGESGIYHVVLRGINQQLIFEDDEDNEMFLDVIEACKRVSGFELYAYCLMSNHVHLLIRILAEDLDQIFKRIGARYVFWFNWKYRRVGHLFQDRFRSEPVETDRYFLAVLRYIHKNPITAGICGSIDGYKWSSFHEYVGDHRIVDRDFALEMTGSDGFVEFHQSENEVDTFIDDDVKRFRITDEYVKELMRKVCGVDTVDAFQKFDKTQRAFYVGSLKDQGITIRQISRLTGVSKGIVERA